MVHTVSSMFVYAEQLKIIFSSEFNFQEPRIVTQHHNEGEVEPGKRVGIAISLKGSAENLDAVLGARRRVHLGSSSQTPSCGPSAPPRVRSPVRPLPGRPPVTPSFRSPPLCSPGLRAGAGRAGGRTGGRGREPAAAPAGSQDFLEPPLQKVRPSRAVGGSGVQAGGGEVVAPGRASR